MMFSQKKLVWLTGTAKIIAKNFAKALLPVFAFANNMESKKQF